MVRPGFGGPDGLISRARPAHPPFSAVWLYAALLITALVSKPAHASNPKPLVAEFKPGSIVVERHSMNWRIRASLEESGPARIVETFASDCRASQGLLVVSRGQPDARILSVSASGTSLADRLFVGLCRAGLPMVERAGAA